MKISLRSHFIFCCDNESFLSEQTLRRRSAKLERNTFALKVRLKSSSWRQRTADCMCACKYCWRAGELNRSSGAATRMCSLQNDNSHGDKKRTVQKRDTRSFFMHFTACSVSSKAPLHAPLVGGALSILYCYTAKGLAHDSGRTVPLPPRFATIRFILHIILTRRRVGSKAHKDESCNVY